MLCYYWGVTYYYVKIIANFLTSIDWLYYNTKHTFCYNQSTCWHSLFNSHLTLLFLQALFFFYWLFWGIIIYSAICFLWSRSEQIFPSLNQLNLVLFPSYFCKCTLEKYFLPLSLCKLALILESRASAWLRVDLWIWKMHIMYVHVKKEMYAISVSEFFHVRTWLKSCPTVVMSWL